MMLKLLEDGYGVNFLYVINNKGVAFLRKIQNFMRHYSKKIWNTCALYYKLISS